MHHAMRDHGWAAIGWPISSLTSRDWLTYIFTDKPRLVDLYLHWWAAIGSPIYIFIDDPRLVALYLHWRVAIDWPMSSLTSRDWFTYIFIDEPRLVDLYVMHVSLVQLQWTACCHTCWNVMVLLHWDDFRRDNRANFLCDNDAENLWDFSRTFCNVIM